MPTFCFVPVRLYYRFEPFCSTNCRPTVTSQKLDIENKWLTWYCVFSTTVLCLFYHASGENSRIYATDARSVQSLPLKLPCIASPTPYFVRGNPSPIMARQYGTITAAHRRRQPATPQSPACCRTARTCSRFVQIGSPVPSFACVNPSDWCIFLDPSLVSALHHPICLTSLSTLSPCTVKHFGGWFQSGDDESETLVGPVGCRPRAARAHPQRTRRASLSISPYPWHLSASTNWSQPSLTFALLYLCTWIP
jgi:hypothetical protein